MKPPITHPARPTVGADYPKSSHRSPLPDLPRYTTSHPKESRSQLHGRGKKLGRVVRDIVGDDLPLMIETLRDVVLCRGNEVGHGIRDRLKAAEMLFDRGWGKPHQTVDVTTDDVTAPAAVRVGSMSDDELALIVGLLESRSDDSEPGLQ